MSWIFYSLLAVNIYSLINLFDKFFLSKKFKSIYSFLLLLNIAYFIFYFLYSIIFWKTYIFNGSFIWAMASGLFYFFMWVFWFKALSGGEVSRSSAIFFTQPIFSSILAVIFLGEILNSIKWLAVIAIVIGAIFSSIETKKIKKGFNSAYIFAFLAAIVSAVGNTISKYAINNLSALTVGAVGYFATLPLYFIFLKDKQVLNEVRSKLTDKKSTVIMIFRGLFGYLAICFFMLALGNGPASLVSALNGGQPLMILIYSTFITIFFPKFIKEEISIKALVYKIISVALIVFGAVVISLF
ncbi:MAG: EamA family transporter [Candidatus Roizmanbacteria bacterium]